MSKEEALQKLQGWKRFQYDSETNGLDPHINKLTCIQFGNRQTNEQIVVDTNTINIEYFKKELESKYLIGHNLKFDLQFLYSENIVPTKVYDTMVVEQMRYLGYPPIHVKGGIGFGLSALAQRYKGIDIDKSIREDFTWRGLDQETITYAAEDVVHLEDLMDSQLTWCRANGMVKGAELECNFVPVIAYLEWCGIKLDINAWKNKMEIDIQKMNQNLEELNKYVIKFYNENKYDTSWATYSIKEDFQISYENLQNPKKNKYFNLPKNSEIIGEIKIISNENISVSKYAKIKRPFPFIKIDRQGDLFTGFNIEPKCSINWASSKQVIELVQILGFDTKIKDKKTNKIKDSVNADVLKKQKGINDEFLKIYLDYKEAEKVVSTYGQKYIDSINPKTGRIHTVFRQLGADTGRMACGSKNSNLDLAKFKKLDPSKVSYPQLQNLPSDKITRSCFISEPGNLMASIDYSNMENRLGADIYNEPNMIAEYLTGEGDIHSLVAKICFSELRDKTTAEIKANYSPLRNKAKSVGFAKQFGGSAHAISNSLSIPLEEAEAIERAYAEGFAGIEAFKKEGSKKVRSTGYVLINPITGHRLNWHDWKEWIARQKTYDSAFWEHYNYLKDTLTEDEWFDNKIRKQVSNDFKLVSKYERMGLNAPTQGKILPCINTLNSGKAEMLILSQAI